MTQVVEFNAIEHLEPIRLRWTAMFYKTPAASFFHTFNWLQTYWHRFREEQQLKVLLVHRRGAILGILPLVIREETTTVGPSRVLTYPTLSQYHAMGPIGPNSTATLVASLRYLARDARDWDVLTLPNLGDQDRGRTMNAMQLTGMTVDAVNKATVARINFNETWSRRLYRRQLRSDEITSNIDTLTFERVRSVGSDYSTQHQVGDLAEACFDLLTVFSTNLRIADSQPDFRALVTTIHRLGMLDLNLLRLQGRVIAFSLNVHCDGVVHQVCAGCSREAIRFGGVSALTLQMVRDSYLRKDKRFYFSDLENTTINDVAAEVFPIAYYEHHAAPALRSRIGRLKQWLSLPRTNTLA